MLFLNEHFNRESTQKSMGVCFCVNILKIETWSVWCVIHIMEVVYCIVYILLLFYTNTVMILITWTTVSFLECHTVLDVYHTFVQLFVNCLVMRQILYCWFCITLHKRKITVARACRPPSPADDHGQILTSYVNTGHSRCLVLSSCRTDRRVRAIAGICIINKYLCCTC